MKTINYLILMVPVVITGCCEKEKPKVSETAGALNVQVEQAIGHSGNIDFKYSGVVEAQKTTALSFATMGAVTEVLVEEGQTVSKGQLLANVNAANAQHAYQMALASQQQAEDAYRRLKPMKDNGTLPEIKWVETETGLAQARSAVSIAQKSLSDCALYAPANGVIGKKNIQPGMTVIPANTVLELLNIQSVYIKIPVPESEISHFKKGDSAQIHIGALSKTVSGTVKEIGVAADILSHTYPVKIEVQNTHLKIKPGMICSVETSMQKNQSGILVSGKALQKDLGGQQFVYVEENGKAQKRPVQTVAFVANKVLVQGELQEGNNIIVSGQQKINTGSLVKIVN